MIISKVLAMLVGVAIVGVVLVSVAIMWPFMWFVYAFGLGCSLISWATQ